MLRTLMNAMVLLALSAVMTAAQCSRKGQVATKKKDGTSGSVAPGGSVGDTGNGDNGGNSGQGGNNGNPGTPGTPGTPSTPTPTPFKGTPGNPTPTPGGGGGGGGGGTVPPGGSTGQGTSNVGINVKIGDDPADEINWDGKTDKDATGKWDIKDRPK